MTAKTYQTLLHSGMLGCLFEQRHRQLELMEYCGFEADGQCSAAHHRENDLSLLLMDYPQDYGSNIHCR